MFYYLSLVTYYFQSLLFVLISVAFLTLLERKVLSYSQNRKGPNKLGFAGLLQPFADAIKLFTKEESRVSASNLFFFYAGPCLSFVISLFFWLVLFSYWGYLDFKYSLIFFILCLSVGAYGLIFAGWSSNSKYSLLGALRAIAQTISYEIPLIFFTFFVIILAKSFFLSGFVFSFSSFCLFSFSIYLFVVSFLCSLAETNRAPFDLAEGESELVSGFNVEYGGAKFALIFLAEYSNIIFFSFFLSYLFFNMMNLAVLMSLVVVFLFFRSSYPRMRYDVLMTIMWKNILLVVIMMYLFFFVMGV